MCGIAGILNFASQRDHASGHAVLERMAETLRHRGPDDSGFHLSPDGACGLAFRRLKIIDLATGQQPITNEDASVWVVFNGEIYNYRALRSDLASRGHRFTTQGDTEVIVHLYEEFGSECFARLEGMFAIAIWDARRRRLTLARDRFGKKPLVYAEHNDGLFFGSELKALMAAGVPAGVDPAALHSYLLFQYIPAPRTIYTSARKLPPGCFVEIDADSPRTQPIQPHAYWRLPHRPFSGTYRDARDELDRLLTRSVEKRLVADVPLGAFLSGGVDSSIVVWLMRRLGVDPLRTFSIGFEDARYDERPYARMVAAAVGAEHHEHVVTPKAREILDTLAYHYDEPFADSSAIPTYYVSQWARTGVTVALTGDAGDECFAGYDRYRAAQMAARLDGAPVALRRAIAAAASLLPHHRPRTWTNRLYRFASALAQAPSRRYLAWMNVFTPEQLAAGYRPEFAAQVAFDEPLDWFERLHDEARRFVGPGADPAAIASHVDLHSYLPGDLLTKVDIASMACSLECRAPFLDHELVTFAASLPIEWRIGKRILKDWARGKLPTAVLDRPKMGFGVPVGAWMRGPLREVVEADVLGPASVSRAVFREDWLRQFVGDHLTGAANHEHALWALLMLERWARRWLPGGRIL